MVDGTTQEFNEAPFRWRVLRISVLTDIEDSVELLIASSQLLLSGPLACTDSLFDTVPVSVRRVLSSPKP